MSKAESEWEKTDMICPECGEPIYKKFDRVMNYHNNTFGYKWFHCLNKCRIGCNNCRYTNTHGECDLAMCYAILKWKPKKKK